MSKDNIVQEMIEAILKDPKTYEGIKDNLLKLNNRDREQVIKILDTKNMPKLATTPVS